MLTHRRRILLASCLAVSLAFVLRGGDDAARAQGAAPSMLVPNLDVRTVVSGLNQPTTLVFLGPGDMFVLEKATGKVQRVVNGNIQGPVLDLAVNSGSERGLLGIALHPDFPMDPGVFLYWTESSTGADTSNLMDVPLLGNRVDRFVWNGSSLVFDRTLIRLRAFQADAGQPLRGNHNGGVIKFGPDGNLYVVIGDNGRRGQLQNLPCGPTATCPGPTVPDDQFGGPQPDNAHLTGVVLRLTDNGTAPADNPFFWGRSRHRRRGWREHPEDLRVWDPQHIRNGLQSRVARALDGGERRRLVLAIEPGHAWIEQRVGADQRAALAPCPVQGD
jgi:glucose/arabinose dehydrogenase